MQPPQIGEHLGSGLIAQGRLFFECLINDMFKFGREIGLIRTGEVGALCSKASNTKADVFPPKAMRPVAIS